MITVTLKPEQKVLYFEKLGTGLQLLNKLGLLRTQALIIRDGELLTWDRAINQGDHITLQKVVSSG